MKQLTWTEQKNYGILLEQFEKIREPKFFAEEGEVIEKIEYVLYVKETIYNGVEYVTHFEKFGVFEFYKDLIDKFIDLKIEGKIDKYADSYFAREVHLRDKYGFRSVDDLWKVSLITPRIQGKISLKELCYKLDYSFNEAKRNARDEKYKSAEKVMGIWFVKENEELHL